MAKPENERNEQDLRSLIDESRLPRHIAVIMDGNGRWAKQQGFLNRLRGHRAGIESVRATIRGCADLGVQVLTLFAFSCENWQRPPHEVKALMHLIEELIRTELPELQKQNVKLIASGRLDDLPSSAYDSVQQGIIETADNRGLIVNLALSYTGRVEIIDAVKKIVLDHDKGKIDVDSIDESVFEKYLYNPDLPDPDLLIRTSGEMRISNFLLWQIAYTEIYVTPVLWPDFRQLHLYEAIIDFQKRQRRFGKVVE